MEKLYEGKKMGDFLSASSLILFTSRRYVIENESS